ncbi:hypothetical protein Hanom_Chr04g00303721 [Helianthus anomalus]
MNSKTHKVHTLRTHLTTIVPSFGHSSMVSASNNMSSHFNRNSSSQKKSLIISGDISS